MAWHKCLINNGNGGGGIMPPSMTSNSIAITSSASSTFTGYNEWQAFDGKETTRWATADYAGNGSWLKIDFASPVIIKRHLIIPYYLSASNSGLLLKSYSIQGSNNNSSWDTIYSETLPSEPVKKSVSIGNASPYRYHRILATSDSYHHAKNISIVKWQMWGEWVN